MNSTLSMSSSSTLPVSNPQATSQSQPSFSSTSFRSFFTRLSNSVRHSLSNRRPWLELIDRTSFSRPESLSEATSRVRKNFSYFRVNYVVLLALVLAISLLSHPFSLFALLVILVAWLFLYTFRPADQPLVILGRTFSDSQILGGLIVLTVILILLTSVVSLLISTIMVGLGIVCAHGAFRVPEDLFLDDQEPLGSGFFSGASGAASSAAAAAAAAGIGHSVMSRV